MSAPGQEELMILTRKLNELLIRYQGLKAETQNLTIANEALEAKLQKREERITELEKRYERVRLSGALLGEGENAGEARRKLNDLVREIDKCVALLNR
jgi:chromosome segregation ATPase